MSSFWSELRQLYADATFTDCEIRAHDLPWSVPGVLCHRLVLSSVSVALREALVAAADEAAANDSGNAVVVCDGVRQEDLQNVINAVYKSLDEENPDDRFNYCHLNPEVSSLLQLIEPGWSIILPHDPGEEPLLPFCEPEIITLPGDIKQEALDFEEFSEEIPLQSVEFGGGGQRRSRRGRKRKNPIVQDDLFNEEREDELEANVKIESGLDDASDHAMDTVITKPGKKRGRPSLRVAAEKELDARLPKVGGQDLALLEREERPISNVYFHEGELRWNRSLYDPLRYRGLAPKKNPSVYRTLFGIAPAEDGNKVLARLLAFSDPSAAEFHHYYELCLEALHAVYGIPLWEFYGQNFLLRHVADKEYIYFKRRKHHLKQRVLEDLDKKSEEELTALIHSKSVQLITEETEPKTAKCFDHLQNGFTLLRDETLPPSDMEALMVVWQTSEGVLYSKLLVSSPAKPVPKSLSLMNLLKTVWCTKKQRIHKDVTIIEDKMEESVKVAWIPKAAEKLKELTMANPERQCGVCGQVFAYKTTRDSNRFRLHMAKHAMQNDPDSLICKQCGHLGENPSALRNHELLEHKTGYQKCPQCSNVMLIESVDDHIKKWHTSDVCEFCGQFCKDKGALLEHKRRSHETFKCEDCGIKIVGIRALKKHRNTVHLKVPPKRIPCPHCQHICSSNYKLKNHIIALHTPDEEKPHKCPHCVKGFSVKAKLHEHIISVHIKVKPFLCRYGCGSAWGNSSNRFKHERIHRDNGETLPDNPNARVVEAAAIAAALEAGKNIQL